jgi:hypothetical protein
VAHRMGPEDAEFMVKQFAPVFDVSDLVNIPNYNAVMRLMIGGLPSQPFTVHDTPPLAGANAELGLAIKQLSAAKFGRSKNAVEADILDRMSSGVGGPAVAAPAPAAVAPAPVAVAPASAAPVAPAVAAVAAPAPVPMAAAPAVMPPVALVTPVASVPVASVAPAAPVASVTPAPVVAQGTLPAAMPTPAPMPPTPTPELAPAAPPLAPVSEMSMPTAMSTAAYAPANIDLANMIAGVASTPVAAPATPMVASAGPVQPVSFATPSAPPLAPAAPAAPLTGMAVVPPPIGAAPLPLPVSGGGLVNSPSAPIIPEDNAEMEAEQVIQAGAFRPMGAPMPQAVAGIAVTPPPIGAPPVDLPPIGAPPVDLPPVDAVAPTAAPLPSPAAALSGNPVGDAGTLSFRDITGGRALPRAADLSAVPLMMPGSEPPILAEPAPLSPAPVASMMRQDRPAVPLGSGEALPDDPYANIDVLGDYNPPLADEPAPIEGRPFVAPAATGEALPGDPYANIDVLGAAPVLAEAEAPQIPLTADELQAEPQYQEPMAAPMTTEPYEQAAQYSQPQAEEAAIAVEPEPTDEPEVVRREAVAMPEPTYAPAITEAAGYTPQYAQAPLPQPRARIQRPRPQVQTAPLRRSRPVEPVAEPYAPIDPPVLAERFVMPPGPVAPPPPMPEVLAEEPPVFEEPVLTAREVVGSPGPMTAQPAAEELIHFVDPNAQAVLQQPAEVPEAVGPDGKLSLNGLPQGVQLVDQPPALPVAPAVAQPAVLPVAPVVSPVVAQAGPSVPTLSVPLERMATTPPPIGAAPMPMAAVPVTAPAPALNASLAEALEDHPAEPAVAQPVAPAAAQSAPVVAADTATDTAASATTPASATAAAPVQPVAQPAVAGPAPAPAKIQSVRTEPAGGQTAQQPALSAAEQIQKAEHEIDDLLSVSLIQPESSSGSHHRLPEPVAPPKEDETGVDLELNADKRPVPQAPVGTPAHMMAQHHGLKVIQPLEPIVPAKEQFAKELAEMQAATGQAATGQVTAAGAKGQPKRGANTAANGTQAAPAASPKAAAPVKVAVAPVAPKPEVAAPQPVAAVETAPAVPTPAPVAPAASAPAPGSDDFEGMPQAESLAAHDVAKAREAHEQQLMQQAAPAPAPVAQAPVPATKVPEPLAAAAQATKPEVVAEDRKKRRRLGKEKPVERIESEAEAEHNKPSAAAAEVGTLTGKLIMPTGEKPAPEPAQPKQEKPKKLAPGEVYVDEHGNVMIGE